MFPKTLCMFFIVYLITNSYGQRLKKKFRKDYTYIDATESFYKINPLPSTWTDAKRICALEGAIFWHPDNESELHAVTSLWEKTRPTLKWLWTGLSDRLVEGRFETVEGKPSSEVYTNWQMGQPDDANGNEDCTHLGIIGDMNDYICDTKALFICKKSLRTLDWNYPCDMPNLDYTFSKSTGKCYKLHTTSLTWTDANDMCQLEQSSLAVIRDWVDAQFLVKLTESTPKPRLKGKYQRGIYHLGFHNRLNEGWQTVQGTPFKVDSTESWFDNYQPDGEEECGAMFFNSRLINTDCEMKSLFICEHDVDNVSTPAGVSLTNSQPYVCRRPDFLHQNYVTRGTVWYCFRGSFIFYFFRRLRRLNYLKIE